jgi:hypothetical protein
MGDLNCAAARDSAAEFALGILPEAERESCAAHLVRCADCRAEVKSFSHIAALLLLVIPGSEPPLGFDRRVLDRARPTHRRARLLVAVVASAAAATVGAIGLTMSGSHQPVPAGQLAYLRQGTSVVGTLTTSGRPTWVYMAVRAAGESGLVTCQLLSRGGSVVTLGTFDLVHGSGSWAAPDPVALARDAGVRLIDSQGRVVASARFG